jgi:hypothetical protein
MSKLFVVFAIVSFALVVCLDHKANAQTPSIKLVGQVVCSSCWAEAADRKAYPLRVDPALWSAVERCAAADLRSVNAEVESLLREAPAARGVKLKAPVRRKRGRPPKETSK